MSGIKIRTPGRIEDPRADWKSEANWESVPGVSTACFGLFSFVVVLVAVVVVVEAAAIKE